MHTSPITRSILLVNLKAARKELGAFEIDTDSPEVVNMYESMLSDAFGTVSICGLKYDAAHALKEVDPTAYRCGLVDWADGLDKSDFEDYTDLESALEDAEAELEAFDAGHNHSGWGVSQ